MTQNTQLTEAQIREIAREEARDITKMTAADEATGEEWSVRRLIDRFELTRREAISAFGLIMIGVGAREAVARVLIGSAEAAPQDDLTVPGTLNAGAVTTADLDINDGTLKKSSLSVGTWDYVVNQGQFSIINSFTSVGDSAYEGLFTKSQPGMVWVFGRDGNNNRFFDFVMIWSRNETTDVLHTMNDGASGRNYRMNGNHLELQMNNGTYDVGACWIGTNSTK